MKINIIVAVDEAGGFGKDGKIPWTIPEDMQRFREITTNHVCVMGRRTYQDMLQMKKDRASKRGSEKTDMIFGTDSILPNRDCYVVSSQDDLETPGATKIGSFSEVYEKYKRTDREVFVIGGYRMFVEAFSYRPTVFMTIVKGGAYNCTIHFPLQILDNYKLVGGEETEECYFVRYEHK